MANNLISKLTEALRFTLGGTKALALVTFNRYGDPQYTKLNFESMVKEGFSRNELIYACIEKTAKTGAQVQLEVVSKRSKERVPDTHPLVTLMEQPNPLMSGYDFIMSIHIYLKLAGEAIYEKERNSLGIPIALWPLRPDWVSVIPGPRGIARYKYQPPGMEAQYLEAKDVVHIRNFDPLNLFRGHAPVAVAARVGDVDNHTTDFIKLFWEEGGVPIGLLSSKMQLQDAQVENIRRRWRERYGGYQNWMEPAVLDMDSTYQRMGLTMQEMGFDILDARNEARICMVMDVPPIVIHAKYGLDRGTYSNYMEARRGWWEDTLTPVYVHIANELNTDLAPDFGTNIKVQWDFSTVPALAENENEKWKRGLDALREGGITVNEFRMYVGLEEAPGRDVFLQNSTKIEVVWGQKSVVQEQQALSQEAQRRALEEPKEEPGKEPKEEEDEEKGSHGGHDHKQAPPPLSTADPLKKKLTRIFRSQEEDILEVVKRFEDV